MQFLGRAYRHEKKKMSHVQIDNDGNRNWLVTGMRAPRHPSKKTSTFSAGCGCGDIAAEKDNIASRPGYCKSYNVHLCFLSFLILIMGLNEVSRPVMADAGDCLECSFERNFLR